MWISCINCGKIVKKKRTGHKNGIQSYTKFCSRSCSSSHNNRLYPKRKAQIRYCKKCNIEIMGRNLLCIPCKSAYEILTKGDLRGSGNSNWSSRLPYIRTLSRKTYFSSDSSKSCLICGYDLHIEVAHRKPIAEFDESAKISEINCIDNLVGLCRNHHWEFDNGHLDL